MYFITARCRDRYPALASERAKEIFWDRFLYYANRHGFVPWVVTVLDNHYHGLGYLRVGTELAEMMRKIHGSVAKLVNDLLPERRVPFWRDAASKDKGQEPQRHRGTEVASMIHAGMRNTGEKRMLFIP